MILILFETVKIQLCFVVIRSRATLVPPVMRCGCASSRGLVAGKALERGIGQRVSPLRIVRLSTHNKQQLLSVLFGNVSKASVCVPSGFPNTQRSPSGANATPLMRKI